MRNAVDAFKAIGEATRLRALRLLVISGEELCACELIDVLEKPAYAISKCLGTLVDAGLISERRDGRMMLYQLAHNPMNDALFQAVAGAPLTEEFRSDNKKLKARLAQRDKNTCLKC